jgi:very-short-patch-repair endonuclease
MRNKININNFNPLELNTVLNIIDNSESSISYAGIIFTTQPYIELNKIKKLENIFSEYEKFIRNELSQYGYKVESHKKNLIPNYNLEIDMYFPEVKAIIEIDGPSHFLPIWGEEKLKKQIKADADKTGLILSRGLAIIRVKNLSDSLSLASQENLKTRLINILDSMKNNFPKESERYIEIEV